LIGSALAESLPLSGYEVRPVGRDAGGRFNPSSFSEADAVIHLAGESIGGIWTRVKKERIVSSRVDGTRAVVAALSRLPRPPKTFLCASAVGYYGTVESGEVTEESPGGKGFLAEVCRKWEKAAREGLPADTRLISLRFALILSPRGGMLRKLLLPARFGLAGPLGSGDQAVSWVSIRDATGMVLHALGNESIRGPLNVTSPEPVTNRRFVETLNRILRRPTPPPIPAFLLRALAGEMAEELLLSGAPVVPRKAIASGYSFRFPSLEPALRDLLGR
jgi:uncharacterized protein (TIGR01777 family)